MFFLFLSILCSALISIVMRLSEKKIKGNVGMLAVNYVMCLVIAAFNTGFGNLFPRDPALPKTLLMGGVQGGLYLCSFLLLQMNVRRNGIVLSTTFMKLGLLVPMVLSIFVFGEMPRLVQILGFIIAVTAIILINQGDGTQKFRFRPELLILLLSGGIGDSMSKIFEELGSNELAPQYLFYTFLVSLLLCIAVVLWKREKLGLPEILFGIILGFPNYYSVLFLLKALESLPAVITYPCANVGAILVVTFAGIFAFREKLTKRQWFAVGLIAAALVLLNI